MNRILLVADRQTTIESLRQNMPIHQMDLFVASNQRSAIQLARKNPPDVVILDNTSGRLSAPIISKALRRLMEAPVIAIVREEGEQQELAATECLVKPYSSHDLADCLQRALAYPRELVVGSLCLNLRESTIAAPHLSEPQRLTPKLFTLMRLFMRHQGVVLSRDQLMSEVWKTDFLEDTRTLDVHVRWLRRLIEPQPEEPLYLQTVRGEGYILRTI